MTTLLAATLLLAQKPPKWKSPLTPIQAPEDYARFVDRLGPMDAGVFAQGDRLTFIARGETNPFVLPYGADLPLAYDPVAKLWIGQGRMRNAERAFFDYTLSRDGKTTSATFYGPKARRPPETTSTLRGTLKTYPFPSERLGETRTVAVYLPPNATSGLNAVYMADGQSCEAYAKILEPLILAGRVAPTALVGLYHGPNGSPPGRYDMNLDFRAREYLKVADPERFEAHLRFVTEEVVPWAEREFGLGSDPSQRALFGFSNGGAFALVASADRPDVFGAVLPFSVAAFDREGLAKTLVGKRLPRFWFASGTLESLDWATGEATRILRAGHATVRFDRYVSGHDEALWQRAFADAMPRVFPSKASPSLRAPTTVAPSS